MPYIKNEGRELFDPALSDISQNIKCAGDLNYVISYLLNNEFQKLACYARGNDLVGVLECAKLEFYRRVLAPYEDTKIIENGDVYHV